MEKRIRIFFACALGAFIGALTALEINGDFWWLGGFAGGLIGYAIYNFGVVIRAVPVAWQRTIGWRPDKLSWKFIALATAAYFSILMSVAIFSVLGVLLSSYLDNRSFWHILMPEKNKISGTANIILYFTVAIPALIFFFGTLLWIVIIARAQKATIDDRRGALALIVGGNPIAVFIYWPIIGLIHSLPYARLFIRTINRLPRTTSRFLWTLFKLIHSEERLLCGVWAAIGSLVGYFAGSAIVGAAAGGLLGVADYEVLSKRLLHLVPSKI